MNFLKKILGWTKANLDWVCIGANAVIVAGGIYYTVQSAGIASKYEFQNQQLLQQNKELLNQNKNFQGVLNKASDHYQEQNRHIQKQDILIEMQNEAIKKLLEQNKQLRNLLNDDFIAASWEPRMGLSIFCHFM